MVEVFSLFFIILNKTICALIHLLHQYLNFCTFLPDKNKLKWLHLRIVAHLKMHNLGSKTALVQIKHILGLKKINFSLTSNDIALPESEHFTYTSSNHQFVQCNRLLDVSITAYQENLAVV